MLIEIYCNDICINFNLECRKDTFSVHVADFWNWLDIVPPVLIYTGEFLSVVNFENYKMIRTLYALTALAMWLRFLYFFRIYKETNFYIRMIVEVIIDMGQFFFIFLITVVAFGHAVYIFFLNHNNMTDSNGDVIF